MKNRKFLTNSILQFSIVFLIINLFYFEKLNFESLDIIFLYEAVEVYILLIFSRLYAPILFALIFNILLKKKPFFKIVEIYLKGHLVNEAVPGLGYFYRYKKSNNKFGISILEYGSIQTLNNLFIFFSLIILAFFLGFIKIASTKILYVSLIGTLFLILVFCILFKFRNSILNFKKINRTYQDLLVIKNKFNKNYSKFVIIFILYFFQSLFQCYIFYKVTMLFGFELGFLNSSYLYISSILITFLIFLNFIGIFELVLSFTSSLFIKNYGDMMVVGLGFRLMGIVALVVIILVTYIFNYLKKKI